MSANSSLDLTSLDFDTLKGGLKSFLKSQDVFKDYDFEASNINILLDVLSYNTFMNSFYLNMIASESFLDSAQLKDSIISHAKELNYLPRSNKSSRVILEPFYISTNKELSTLVMPKGTMFSGSARGVSHNFVTDSVYINNTPIYNPIEDANYFYISTRIYPTDGSASYIKNPFILYEGKYIKDTFVVDYTIENQKFILTDPTVDTDSITVTVTENTGASVYDYIFSSTLLDIKNTDPRYFLQPAEGGKYEIIFGDDIIGRRPKNNAVITVEYRTNSGINGNGVTKFRLDTNIAEASGGQIKKIKPLLDTSTDLPGGSYGGDDAESIDQIRYKAPRYFQTQERAVTTSDYEILLRNKFPEIEAIAVFGGETFDPPIYGKVYVSVKLKDIDNLPDSKKTEYNNYISTRSPLAIDAIFISPETLYFAMTVSVNYNINVTTSRPDQIKTAVVNSIKKYNDTYFNDFNVTLRKSKLINTIDSADPSIISNQTKLAVYKEVVPFLGISQNITIRLGVEIDNTIPPVSQEHDVNYEVAVYSSGFIFNGQTCYLEADGTIDDNGNGNIRIISKSSTKTSLIKNTGTVNYNSGTITLSDFNIDAFIGNQIRIYAIPKYDDITVIGNNIFSIGLDELNVTINTVRE